MVNITIDVEDRNVIEKIDEYNNAIERLNHFASTVYLLHNIINDFDDSICDNENVKELFRLLKVVYKDKTIYKVIQGFSKDKLFLLNDYCRNKSE